MNRAERRSTDRKIQKVAKTINKLSPNQVKLIDSITNEKAAEKIEAALISYQRVINASLFEHGFSNKQVENIFKVANDFLQEESIKAEKLNEELKRSGNIKMARKKIEDSMINEIKTLMGEGKNRTEIIDATLYKFPNMSKAMIINAYSQVKEDLKEESKEDPDVQEAMEKVADILDEGEKKEVENKEVEKILTEADKVTEKSELKCTERTIKEAITKVAKESSELSKLKVLSMVVEGENGTYRVCDKGVELTNNGLTIFFENTEQLDNFASEYKEVFKMLK